jgi:GrpB-like predicted nucleotidyltransferase (UPF0157 family)/GNAT superfamily N-acetyltransferase
LSNKSTEAPIRIEPYDPSWPARFDEERLILLETLAPWLAGPIEHIGSTAVPGLAAKPVIDVMAAVENLDASRPAIAALAKIGYVYFPYRADVMHWFCKPSAAVRTHHLHLVPLGSSLWSDRVAFRDYLRNNPAKAAEYAELKKQLARKYEFDRETYTDAKELFVRDVLKLALGELPTTGIQIKRENVDSAVAATLIGALNAELSERYPEEGATHFRLDPDEVTEGRGAFFVAYADSKAVGCGAVRLLDAESAEIKRMFVIPEARGRGISRIILDALESEGRRLGAKGLLLETGDRQGEALRLYTKAGFVRIPAFGEYVGSPLSVCMKKDLGTSSKTTT